MVQNFYLDESGNSGDVLNSGHDFDFNGQPVFSLACLGIDNVSALNDFISYLMSKFKIQGQEIKSTKVYKKKPNLIVELVDYLDNNSIPIFIEAVDKKYYISANLVNCHVMPPYYSPAETSKSQMVRNHFADFIYYFAPPSVFEKFLRLCMSPSEDKLLASFKELDLFASRYADNYDEANFLAKNLKESLDDYNKLKNIEGDSAYERFVPVPDTGKRNQSIWMLPNLSSFTSIYARINQYLQGSISNAKIVHDEQAHFDDILLQNKSLLEEFEKGKASYIKNANYDFFEAASMTFAKSHENGAIQVADILAGMSMKYLQEKLEGRQPSQEIVKAYNTILRNTNPNLGTGINLVTTSKIHHELHF